MKSMKSKQMKEEPLHKLEVVNLLMETDLWNILDLSAFKVVHIKQEKFECIELKVVFNDTEGKWIVGQTKGKNTYTADYESLVRFLKEIQDD